MATYGLSQVQKIKDPQRLYYGFDVIDALGRPILSFAFDSQEEAAACRQAIRPVISTTKLIIQRFD